ncbi:hypothetical protein RhiirA5_415387 [Rhizophagus irregularis]|uniref:Uncharacterized protein n=1 Tax=Rhizophagus irregularis TaxID=588596 RepID=A0A2N0PS81_9GLOM|nr:hypothetical protein RhiirA5_415387 [Rhizophagus irregularis]
MEALFNCLFPNTDSLIPIPIYNNDNGSFVEFDVKNISDMKLWRVNAKEEDIRSVSTEEYCTKTSWRRNGTS